MATGVAVAMITHTLGPGYNINRWKNKLCSIAVSGFGSKKSVRGRRVHVVTELVTSGAQCNECWIYVLVCPEWGSVRWES